MHWPKSQKRWGDVEHADLVSTQIKHRRLWQESWGNTDRQRISVQTEAASQIKGETSAANPNCLWITMSWASHIYREKGRVLHLWACSCSTVTALSWLHCCFMFSVLCLRRAVRPSSAFSCTMSSVVLGLPSSDESCLLWKRVERNWLSPTGGSAAAHHLLLLVNVGSLTFCSCRHNSCHIHFCWRNH